MLFEPKFFNIEYIFYRIYLFFKNLGIINRSDGDIVFTGYQYLIYLKVFVIFISVFSTFLIIDFLHRLFTLRRQEAAEIMEKVLNNMPSEDKKNQRWEEVMRLIGSDNESNWKLAIIEADKMLDDLLSILGYQGATLGDKLMAVEKGDMLSLDEAWEAHKYRNRIAHEVGFQVTEREARRIIGLYSKVFQEYKFI